MSRFRLSIGLLAAATLSGCGTDASDLSGPYRANVLAIKDLGSVASPSKAPEYTLRSVNLSTLDDLATMSGDSFKLVSGGEYAIKSVEGSIIRPDKFTGGEEPGLHFEIVDGVIVPQDYSTLAILSSYYQFELVAENLPSIAGITIDSMIGRFGKKFKILFEPERVVETDSTDETSSSKLNAAFVPGQSQFLLFRRSPIERVPLATNLQVIAHEFGHAVWDYQFSEGDGCAIVYEDYSFSGMNEGFADFLSYTLTGSTDVLGATLGGLIPDSPRNFSKIDFDLDDLFGGTAELMDIDEMDTEICAEEFYCLGTLFARALFDAQAAVGVDQASLEARGGFNATVVAALAGAKARLVADGTCEAEGSELASPESLGAFLRAFALGIAEPAIKDAVCDGFVARFGDYGFASEYRSECP